MVAMATSTGGTTATTTAMRRASEGDGGEEDAKTAPISGQQTYATAHAHIARAHRTHHTHVLMAGLVVSRYGPSGEVLDDYYTYDYASDREFDADDEDDDGGGGDTYGQGAAGGSVYGEFEEMADIHSDHEHMD